MGGTHILIEASTGCLRIYAFRLKCVTRWLGWMLSPFSHCTGGFRCLICNVHFYHSLNGVEKADLYNTNPRDWTLMSFDDMVVWVEVHPICRLVVFCLLESNAILLRSVFVNPVFLREDQFAWSSNSPLQRVLFFWVRHVLYLLPMYTSRRAVGITDRSISVDRGLYGAIGIQEVFTFDPKKNKTSWTLHLKFFTVCTISLW